jgi:hypothetical protein
MQNSDVEGFNPWKLDIVEDKSHRFADRFFSSQCPDQLWGPTSLLSRRYA